MQIAAHSECLGLTIREGGRLDYRPLKRICSHAKRRQNALLQLLVDAVSTIARGYSAIRNSTFSFPCVACADAAVASTS